MRQRFLTFAAVSALLGAASHAHDFWIEATSYSPPTGRVAGLEFHQGESFRGEIVPRRQDRLARFEIAGPGGISQIAGREGAATAGLFRPEAPGLHVVVLQTKPLYVELPPDRFEAYLAQEGLEALIESRNRAGGSSQPGREHFTRCVKLFLPAEGSAAGDHTRRFGLPLEIIPEANPAAARQGESISLRILFRDAPAPGVLVAATPKEDPGQRQTSRTDAEGRVSFTLGEEGYWLVQAVHAVREEPGSRADWHSYWAGMNFFAAKPGEAVTAP